MILIPVAAGGPSLTDILTAIGTVGAVVAAVGIALWTDWRSARRIREEREHSDRQLAAEHERGDRLLAEEREHSRTQIEEERRVTREREQMAEAYQVRVVMGQMAAGELNEQDEADDSVQKLAVMVVNGGSYTITRVEAQFSYDGRSLVPHGGYKRVTGFMDLPSGLRGAWHVSEERAMRGVLTPWDAGIRFESDKVHVKFLSGPYPLVRWTDRRGTRWEHRRGEVRQVRDNEEWTR